MNCGNCGKSNDYDAKVCVQCGSTLALTEYFRPTGFVEKKNTPKKAKKEPWDQEILTDGYKKREHTPVTKTAEANRLATSSKEKPSARKNAPDNTRPPKTGQASKASSAKAGQGSQTGAKSSKAKTQPKKISENKKKGNTKGRAYNHTTKKLSIAEKAVNKTKAKNAKSRKWVFPVILASILLFVAAAIFVGTLNAGTREDPFARVAEDFVCAVVMNDEDQAGECIHPKMYGTVRPLDYDNVQRCEVKAYTVQQEEIGNLAEELRQTYGIEDPVTELYRIRVGYTVYGDQTYGATETMDVLAARIGGKVYAVKTENPE